MKRSEIDAIIDETQAIMRSAGVALPPFAEWTPEEWRRRGSATRRMRERFLGWNIVAFDPSDFRRAGIAVFTTRMGDWRDLPTGRGRLYGEKIFVVRDGQVVPHHYHLVKSEDVTNRGGATLAIEMVPVDERGRATNDAVRFERDGLDETVPAGSTVRLRPGESVTLAPRIAHAFRAEGGYVVCGEVSLANDDATDNLFLTPLAASGRIDEDAPARRLVVADYRTFDDETPGDGS